MNFFVYLLVLCLLCGVVLSEETTIIKQKLSFHEIGREFVEQGRTLVHHALKRFMVILPAIFFKMGIAFTLLILVTLVAVNNGFIGFLLLVVGISSVLARLQENKRQPVSLPSINALPYHHHHPIWDRNDNNQGSTVATYTARYNLGNLGNYYMKYPYSTKI